MAKVKITGWEYGLRKVELSKLQMSMIALPLKESKKNVDKILDGHEVIIEVTSQELAREFVEEVRRLGARGHLMD